MAEPNNETNETTEKTETPLPEPVPEKPAEEKVRTRVKVRKIPVISIRSFILLSLIVLIVSVYSLFYTHSFREEVKPKVKKLEKEIKETNSFITMVDKKLENFKTETTESFQQTIVILRYLCETHGRKVNDVVEMIFRMAWRDDWEKGKVIMGQYLRTGRQDLWDMTMKRLSAEQAKELLGVELPEIFQPNTPQTGTW
jgi:ribosome-associated translation inhibitor RaiA